MPAERFVEQLNIQIGNEFAAHQQYVACAVYYDALTMPQMASFFYAQALGGARPRDDDGQLPDRLRRPGRHPRRQRAPGALRGPRRPGALALQQERRVSAQINELTQIAREEADFASDQFMQWFIKEQVEEIATMSDLVTVVRRSSDIEAIEDYVQREQSGEGPDPTAPTIAGG